MNNLAIIVSGPTSSGKSTLIRRSDFAQMLTDSLKLKNFNIEDKIFYKNKFHMTTEKQYNFSLNQKNIIYHYDFIKSKKILTNKYQFISGIFDNFINIVVVLCVCSANDLQNRYKLMENIRRKNRNLKKYLDFEVLFKLFYIPHSYKDKEKVFELYNDWLNFIKKNNPLIIIYDSKNNFFLNGNNFSISSKIKDLINT